MKKDPDFWFWIATMAVWVAMFAMWLAAELNFYSSWFGILFIVVLVLATVYMGVTLVRGRKSKTPVAPQAPVGKEQGAPRRFLGNILQSVCLCSISGLSLLTANGLLPRSAWFAAPVIVLFGVWIWYELIGSKREEIGR